MLLTFGCSVHLTHHVMHAPVSSCMPRMPRSIDGRLQLTMCGCVCVCVCRACAVSYPTREAEQLLWVWPSSERHAESEADAAAPPGMCPHLFSGNEEIVLRGWYFRCVNIH